VIELGYPELAVGDHVKDGILIESGQLSDSMLSEKVKLHYAMLIFVRQLEDPNCPSKKCSAPGELWRM
jgi:hypothetical protein